MVYHNKCCIPFCENSSVIRHTFPNPNKDINRFKKWIDACKNSVLSEMEPWKVYKSIRVCHQHFEQKYISSWSHKLFTTAVPTLNLPVRSLSMAAVDKVVNFEEMEKLAHDKKVLIIDVREPDEVKSTSKIGCSINIPLNKLQHELKDTTNEDFNKMYGQSKPVSTTPLIFYCMRGVRALKALQLSESLGFVNARYYKGSWEEWSKKHK